MSKLDDFVAQVDSDNIFQSKEDYYPICDAQIEFETIPVYGDPVMMNGNLGALSGNSIYFTLDNIDYYIAGNDLSSEELLGVASSISNSLITVAGK